MNTVTLDESIELAQRRASALVRPAAQAAGRVTEEPGAYAGMVTRVLAFALDALIVNAVAVAVGLAVGLGLSVLHLPSDVDVVIAAVAGGAWIVWSVGYFVFFWSSAGQTPGDRVMRIRVVDARSGDVLRVRQAALRFVGLFLAALPLLAGLWMMLWDERRRCLQDRIARTLVLYEADEQPPRPVRGPRATVDGAWEAFGRGPAARRTNRRALARRRVALRRLDLPSPRQPVAKAERAGLAGSPSRCWSG